MARFANLFLAEKDDPISDLIDKIFATYDTDMSGALNRRETLKLVNNILKS
jgi:hypothetical protein